MELARGLEGGVDDLLRNAVTGQVEEADVLAGMPDLRRHGVESAGVSPESRPEVDHRDRPRRFLEILTAMALKMFIEWLLLAGDVSITPGALGRARISRRPAGRTRRRLRPREAGI